MQLKTTFILTVAIVLFTYCSAESKMDIQLENEKAPFYANGFDQKIIDIKEITLNGRILYSNKHYQVFITGGSIKLISDQSGEVKDGVTLILISTMKPGVSELMIKIYDPKSNKPSDMKDTVQQKTEKKYLLTTMEDDRDFDQDGFPDIAELKDEKDRLAFLNWFTQLVEIQYYYQNERWSKGNRDCSGLARFAFAEALKKHDDDWKRKWNMFFDWSIQDVEKFHYPHIPILKNKLFRVKEGPFSKHDLENQTFDIFATSEKLMRYNTNFITKDLTQAQIGDLLFYKNRHSFHVMIFLGHRSWLKKVSEEQESLQRQGIEVFEEKNYVVYHTGPIEDGKGEVRKVPVAKLKKHPSPIWRPIRENANFLGVFRWNILN